jgi:hypothetical protein
MFVDEARSPSLAPEHRPGRLRKIRDNYFIAMECIEDATSGHPPKLMVKTPAVEFAVYIAHDMCKGLD